MPDASGRWCDGFCARLGYDAICCVDFVISCVCVHANVVTRLGTTRSITNWKTIIERQPTPRLRSRSQSVRMAATQTEAYSTFYITVHIDIDACGTHAGIIWNKINVCVCVIAFCVCESVLAMCKQWRTVLGHV